MTDGPFTFPSLEWMQAYADTVADDPRAMALQEALAGRFRFVITSDRTLDRTHVYDLVVDADGITVAEGSRDDGHRPRLTAKADHARWRALVAGEADFIMSFLMRKLTIEGDLASLRQGLIDAQPLLDCMRRVPTTFR